ncbi:hypothetical protein [Halorussus caseinilyticus]|uniref:Cox cluster protein n=1 Tax=Halorussus caseinilyticus TaxID=3034025 RepID=A0ABD5WH87_9EURY|nr:hypothetical protein [Halorussus sp. DT72]
MKVETQTAERDSPTDSGFPWHYLVYAGPANLVLSLLTAVAIGVYMTTDIRAIGTVAGLGFLVLALGGFLTVILVEVGLFFDIASVQDADVQWSPSRLLYMLGALPFAPLVGTVYVVQRRQYLG